MPPPLLSNIPRRSRVCAACGVAFLMGGAALGAETVSTDFEGGWGPWIPFYSGTWQIQEQSGNHIAALTVAGADRPPVRRPRSYLFLAGHSWSDCVFTVRAKTVEPNTTTARDVVLIFGYADDTHYYYAHISSRADAVHSVIMKVAGTQRATIHVQANPTPALNGSWQTIRVEHAAAGTIRVFVDNLVTPRLTANDTTYPAGALAFGSFDDRAQFDDVVITGTAIPADAPSSLTLERNGAHELTLSYPTRKGLTYQLFSGSELPVVTPASPPTAGLGGVETHAVILGEAPRRFFQVTTTHPLLAQP
ncbi:hypothetical protein OKA05_22725 [Luteolibacter arcticus]|uniref:DUF1080 domain-containing protein n=1 Tax=Luteolibacter arcticus TaxID=1581411 RepID=A0ABT3GPD6_9BACT|nr:hypothetical protein [Luteolibacter arcticus]MCW1925393.1 hypothetical protein [Luteolibacter arcticus]